MLFFKNINEENFEITSKELNVFKNQTLVENVFMYKTGKSVCVFSG